MFGIGLALDWQWKKSMLTYRSLVHSDPPLGAIVATQAIAKAAMVLSPKHGENSTAECAWRWLSAIN